MIYKGLDFCHDVFVDLVERCLQCLREYSHLRANSGIFIHQFYLAVFAKDSDKYVSGAPTRHRDLWPRRDAFSLVALEVPLAPGMLLHPFPEQSLIAGRSANGINLF